MPLIRLIAKVLRGRARQHISLLRNEMRHVVLRAHRAARAQADVDLAVVGGGRPGRVAHPADAAGAFDARRQLATGVNGGGVGCLIED